jgi:hypothetical protein
MSRQAIFRIAGARSLAWCTGVRDRHPNPALCGHGGGAGHSGRDQFLRPTKAARALKLLLSGMSGAPKTHGKKGRFHYWPDRLCGDSSEGRTDV